MGGRDSCSPQFVKKKVKKVKTLLGFFGQRCHVDGPGKVLGDVYTQECSAAHPLHCSIFDWLAEDARCAPS